MIYLDNNSTTRIIPEIFEALSEYTNIPMNPSSIHYFGREGRKLLESSRSKIASSLGIKIGRGEYKVIFTSGATEANNLVLKNHEDYHVFYSATEHPSVYNLCNQNEKAIQIPVDKNGVLDLSFLENNLIKLKGEKILISVMAANNETGVINNLKAISNLAREYDAKIHSDAVQAVGKIPLNITDLDLDFVSISGHKIGAMSGVGALIAKDHHSLKAINVGGGQEKGERSGTENLIGAISLANATEFAVNNIVNYTEKTKKLRDFTEEELKKLGGVIISSEVDRLPNTILVASNTSSNVQLIKFDSENIAVSNGSACSSGRVQASHVLKAMKQDDIASNVIRVSFSEDNTLEEAKKFVQVWKDINHSI